jgi:hypothetical protein
MHFVLSVLGKCAAGPEPAAQSCTIHQARGIESSLPGVHVPVPDRYGVELD